MKCHWFVNLEFQNFRCWGPKYSDEQCQYHESSYIVSLRYEFSDERNVAFQGQIIPLPALSEWRKCKCMFSFPLNSSQKALIRITWVAMQFAPLYWYVFGMLLLCDAQCWCVVWYNASANIICSCHEFSYSVAFSLILIVPCQQITNISLRHANIKHT